MLNLKSITGRYFIQKEPLAADRDSGQGLVMRGQILGVIEGTELGSMPIYLCELWPADDSDLDVRTETAMALPQLLNAWLYDDQAIFIEAWRKLIVDSRKAEQAARRERARMERQAKAQLRAVIDGVAAGQPGASVRAVQMPDGRKLVMLDPFSGGAADESGETEP